MVPLSLLRPQLFLLLFFFLAASSASLSSSLALAPPPRPPPPSPTPPPPFWFGVATSSYQIEGGAREGGRGPSIWDSFSHSAGNKTARGETGDVAADFYHRYATDIELARQLGVHKFRLSLSWSRIFPNRTLNDGGFLESPNEEGFAFYERVLDALEEAGIEPLVTLYHWDLPQALQDAYGGWTSERIIDDFRAYARTVFERLGARKVRKRVSRSNENDKNDDGGEETTSSSSSSSAPSAPLQINYWTTLNEPWVFCFLGHTVGIHAPGLKSPEAGWTCARNSLLAHLAAAEEFEKVFGVGAEKNENEKNSPPLLSVNVPCQWAEPWDSDSESDRQLARTALDFDGMGIFADVLFKGQWPESVLNALSAARDSGLFVPPPTFSADESAGFLSHRPRYFALNFYTSYWAKPVVDNDEKEEEGVVIDPSTGVEVAFTKEQRRPDPSGGGKEISIGLPGAPAWLFATPWAMRSILNEINERYEPEEIVVTENGFATKAEQDAEEKEEEEQAAKGNEIFDDGDRVSFFQAYLASALAARTLDGVPLTGFCAWSLLDNFEWADGYSMRFGIVRVDFGTQQRTVKRSALWLRGFFSSSGGGRGREVEVE